VFHQYEKLGLGLGVFRNDAPSSAAKSCRRYGGAHKLQLERSVLEHTQVRVLAREEGLLESGQWAARLCGRAVATGRSVKAGAADESLGPNFGGAV
jgi:hypothetical protein